MSDRSDLPSQALSGAGLLASVVLIGLAAVGGATAEAAMAALSGGWFLLVQPEAKRLFGGDDDAKVAE